MRVQHPEDPERLFGSVPDRTRVFRRTGTKIKNSRVLFLSELSRYCSCSRHKLCTDPNVLWCDASDTEFQLETPILKSDRSEKKPNRDPSTASPGVTFFTTTAWQEFSLWFRYGLNQFQLQPGQNLTISVARAKDRAD